MDDKSRDKVSIGYKTLDIMDPTKNQMFSKDKQFLFDIRHPPNVSGLSIANCRFSLIGL
jgi:hypothetical protein